MRTPAAARVDLEGTRPREVSLSRRQTRQGATCRGSPEESPPEPAMDRVLEPGS